MCGILVSCVLPLHLAQRDSHNGTANGRLDADTSRKELAARLQSGIDMIQNRGPDGSGVWTSRDGRVGLAHCRLAINDLSPRGSQPLHSVDGKMHAVVNGELYENERLREVCAAEHGFEFVGSSDSELVVALYSIYGAPAMFEHLRGEFAFVLLDEREGSRRVMAGRDRFGIKPLLWTVVGDRLLLAPEAKAFLPMGWKPEWDVGGIAGCGWMLDERTVFKGVNKVMPGCWMEMTDERGVEMHRYWDADYPDKTKQDPRTVDDMMVGVRERLVEAVRLRLRADVPVGVYLSGGIDSSVVAGIVTDLIRNEDVRLGSERASRLKCFSIQFAQGSGYDESEIAARTADWLGAEMMTVDMTEDRLAADFAQTAYQTEHHHFDLNSVAKFALSKLVREHGIKVVLTGEGSDEHFCGYPIFAPEFLAEPDLAMPETPLARDDDLRERLLEAVTAKVGTAWRAHAAGEKSEKGKLGPEARHGNSVEAGLVAWQPPSYLYSERVRQRHLDGWDARKAVRGSHPPAVRAKMANKWHPAHSALYAWNTSCLSNIILTCLGDRSEMAHGVEGRTPFLDHRLAEFVNSLPPSVKLAYDDETASDRETEGRLSEKWILREAARPYVTDELYGRKKMAFWAPVRWPRGGRLHDMFGALLTREAVEELGFVDWAVVEEALGRAFDDGADQLAFQLLCCTASWVVIGRRFGVKTAVVA